jgi:hypothetical protein
MVKPTLVLISDRSKQTALIKAAEAQRKLGKRVTIQKTVEVALELLDTEQFVKKLEQEEAYKMGYEIIELVKECYKCTNKAIVMCKACEQPHCYECALRCEK